jgi:hypothetical protein
MVNAEHICHVCEDTYACDRCLNKHFDFGIDDGIEIHVCPKCSDWARIKHPNLFGESMWDTDGALPDEDEFQTGASCYLCNKPYQYEYGEGHDCQMCEQPTCDSCTQWTKSHVHIRS